LVVDAESDDRTREIVKGYAQKYEFVRLLEHAGRRGEGRNFGVGKALGALVAFIDGDCIANPFWLQEVRRGLVHRDVVAGRTIQIGYWAFQSLDRVELDVHGVDVSYPSCNLAYRRTAFEKAGGFDDWFVTAEDIDLNLRAVERGASLGYREEAIVYHRARDTFAGFFRQAFWNGYGRKQLTLKHGSLWSQYSFRRMFRSQLHFWGVLRLSAASFGYIVCLVQHRRRRPAV
ncbi:MAG TPA: glycosyltransferase, partial [Candidatus Thermoplasmatota archaeon]|nr:glycosyltransferase [Candidatus Thermoplasmatota archaeon]